ncbi:MAG: Glycosyltransferase (GT4) [Bacteroidetes bacterium]|nr:MAG: Glycosyltransferase (GT4) [Bacteroidota bacterium]
MSSRKKILVFIDWYLPGFKAGGPIRSVAAMIKLLGRDYDFSVVTSDRDFGSDAPHEKITCDNWTTAPDGTRIFYATHPDANVLSRLISEEKPDVIYLNSFFSFPFSILPLRLARHLVPGPRIVLAPRGMLGAGALKIKRFKKRAFIAGAKLTGLYRQVTWHASSEQEADEIRKVFGRKTDVHVAMNLSLPGLNGYTPRSKKKGELNLFFLSRISRKKNLLGAIRMLGKIPPGNKIRFTIIGPAEDEGYRQECLFAAKNLPPEISVVWAGAVDHTQLAGKLEDEHILFLPTQHENFGHVILESWAASCPVIISDQTPWHNLEAGQTGWDIALGNEDAFVAAIVKAVGMEESEYRVWSEKSFRFAEAYTGDEAVITANRSLFR